MHTSAQTKTNPTIDKSTVEIVDETIDTVDTLSTKVTLAKHAGIPYVETSGETLKRMFPNKPDTEWFMFKDIPVYKFGCREKIEKMNSMSGDQLLHGAK